jgi:hypothetical protein
MPARDNPLSTVPAVERVTVPVSAAMLHDDWVAAETEATLALAAWRSSEGRGRRALAYAFYAAALDTEEAAAARLEHWLAARG